MPTPEGEEHVTPARLLDATASANGEQSCKQHPNVSRRFRDSRNIGRQEFILIPDVEITAIDRTVRTD